MLTWTGTYMPNMRSSLRRLGFVICSAKANRYITSQLSISMHCSSPTKKHHCLRLKKCLKQVHKGAREERLNHQGVSPQVLPLATLPPSYQGVEAGGKLFMYGRKDQNLLINMP